MSDQLDAERSVLGLILKGANFGTVLAIVKNADFLSVPKHQYIFDAMESLYRFGEPLDVITVKNQLRLNQKIDDCGGAAYLVELADSVFTDWNIEAHAELIAEQFRLRYLKKSLADISLKLTTNGTESSEIIGLTYQAINEVEATKRLRAVKLSDIAGKHINSVLAGPQKDGGRLIQTRLPDLDDKIGGLFRGEMVIIGGPASMGKTMLAVDICLWNQNYGRACFIVSIDQTEESLVMRMITNMTGVSKTDMKRGLSKIQQDLVSHEAAVLATYANVTISDSAEQTILDIRAMARQIKRQCGLDILVVDYIQMIPDHKKAERRDLGLGEISRQLKATAKELDCVVLCISQINRQFALRNINPNKGEWAFPRPSDLKDSGALEQDANMIIFPWVPEELVKKHYGETSDQYKNLCRDIPNFSQLAYMVVAKNKDGWTGIVECRRDAAHQKFYCEDRIHVGRD